jgi:hypothetical protein
MSINNMEQLLEELKPQIRKLLATSAAARAAQTVRVETADSPLSLGRQRLWIVASNLAILITP